MSSGDETSNLEVKEVEPTTSEAAEDEKDQSKSIIVVSRGAKEGDPPLWTIVNSSAPCRRQAMNSTAVNVITGTRITHGHPLLLG